MTSARVPRSDLDAPDTGATVGDVAVVPAPVVPATFTTYRDLDEHVGALRSNHRMMGGDLTALHRRTTSGSLAELAALEAKRSVPDVLDRLSEVGFAWRDIARMIGVSVPAVQKWRRGDPVAGENRGRLARLAALTSLLAEEHMIDDVGSWFDVPICPPASTTPIDLVAMNREELVLDYAASHLTPEEVMTEADPNWRSTAESNFDVVLSSDGIPSIVPKPKER